MTDELAISWGGAQHILKPGRTYSIGRDPGNDLVVEGNGHVSRRHATLGAGSAGWRISDAGSSRGLWSDGAQVAAVEVPWGSGVAVSLGDAAAGVTLTLAAQPRPQANGPLTPNVAAAPPAGPPPGAPPGRPLSPAAAAQAAPVLPPGFAPPATPGPAGTSPGPEVLRVSAAGHERQWTPPGPYVIGRDPSCDLVIASPVISGRHAQVTYADGRWTVTDLDSKRGLWVDDEQVKSAVVTGLTAVSLAQPPAGERLLLVHGETPRHRRKRRSHSTLVVSVVALVVIALVAAVAIVVVSKRDQPAGLSAKSLAQVKRATVRVVSDDGWGSGTIISATGLILTNAHVAAPAAPGSGVRDKFPAGSEKNPKTLGISLPVADDRPAQPRYRAKVVVSNGYLDFAVLQIVTDVHGNPISPSSLHLPVLPLGSAMTLHTPDHVTVAGYPAAAETNSLDINQGEVSSFAPDPLTHKPRTYINTSARISHGNSGGAAVDDKGRLIGVPSQFSPDQHGSPSGIGQIRAIDLAMPLIRAALHHTSYDRYQYLHRLTGKEHIRGLGVGSENGGCNGDEWDDEGLTSFTIGSTILPAFKATAIGRGSHVMFGLYQVDSDGGFDLLNPAALVPLAAWKDDADIACFTIDVDLDPSQLTEGSYAVIALIGPNYDVVAGNTPTFEVKY